MIRLRIIAGPDYFERRAALVRERILAEQKRPQSRKTVEN